MANGRVWRSRSPELALFVLGLVSLILLGTVVTLTIDSGHEPLWALLLFPALGVAYVVIGLLGSRGRVHEQGRNARRLASS